METDRSALIAAILAAPGDDAPRLILADLLEETGVLTAAEAGLLRHGHGRWVVDCPLWLTAAPKLLWAFPEQTFPAAAFDGREANFGWDPMNRSVGLIVGAVPGGAGVRCGRCEARNDLNWYAADAAHYAGWFCRGCASGRRS